MIVVLDTCAMRNTGFQLGGPFQVLAQSLRVTGYKLVFPKVVVEEFMRQFRQAADKWRQDARKLGLTIDDMDATVKQRMDAISEEFRKWNCEIRTYPTVSHEAMVLRIMEERKPFGAGSDRSYRDTLIWETVLELCRETEDPIALVTGNSKDFGGPNLHKDLLEDLASEGFQGRVTLFKDIKEFNDAHVIPMLGELDTLKVQIERGTAVPDLMAFVQSHSTASMINEALVEALGNRVATKDVGPVLLTVHHVYKMSDAFTVIEGKGRSSAIADVLDEPGVVSHRQITCDIPFFVVVDDQHVIQPDSYAVVDVVDQRIVGSTFAYQGP